ncbi:MAG: MBL fold metallo-hydrolase [Pseudomonadota bacterium]
MIHDLAFPNSAWVTAPERLMLRGGSMQRVDVPIRYARFTHPVRGRCLIDTGYTHRVTSGPRSTPLRLYARFLRPRLTEHALGNGDKADTVVLTHLHADHVSGLRDLDGACVYGHAESTRRLLSQGSLNQRRHGLFAELLPPDFAERLKPFEDAANIETPLGEGGDLFGDGSVVVVPLPGHMDGHHGVLLQTADGPLLYAADAQWLRAAVLGDRLPTGPAAWITHDREAAQATAARLAAYERKGGRVVYCHDPGPVTPC